MKIVILGATGQIGSLIYDALKGVHQVIGTSRKQSPGMIQFDPFRDNWSMLGRTEVLINCIGQIETKNSYSFYKIHVELAKLIIKNRQAIGNPRIIQISALCSSIDHKVEFLRTKGVADEYLLQHLGTAVVRPSIVCTHCTTIIKKMLMLLRIAKYANGLVFVPKGFPEMQIQPVNPTDLASVVERLCTTHDLPRVINAVGPDRLSFDQIIKIMFEARAKKYRLIRIPKIVMDVFVSYIIGFLMPNLINSEQYQLLFEDNVADTTQVEKFLGTPLTSTKQFFVNEFRYVSN